MSILSRLLRGVAPIAWASMQREIKTDILLELPQGCPNPDDTATRCAKAAIARVRRRTNL